MIKLNNFFKIFIRCQLILLQVSLTVSQNHTRIVGGTPTTIDKAPFVLQLLVDGEYNCGATLVDEQFAITAGHCVIGVSPERLVVVGGATKLTDNGIRSRISKIIVPTSYNYAPHNADIAVLKLNKPLRGPSVKPAGKCTKSWKHGDPMQVFGWGRVLEDNDNIPLQLRTVTVNVIDNSICRNMYRNRLTSSMFCGGAPGKDACSGDSGGAALVNNEYCGIVSWGIGCGRPNYPGVYTSIPEMLPFITAAMQS